MSTGNTLCKIMCIHNNVMYSFYIALYPLIFMIKGHTRYHENEGFKCSSDSLVHVAMFLRILNELTKAKSKIPSGWGHFNLCGGRKAE